MVTISTPDTPMQTLSKITIYSPDMPTAKFYMRPRSCLITFDSTFKKGIKMAPLLQYNNGLLVPITSENNCKESVSKLQQNANRNMQSYRKQHNYFSAKRIANLLIVITIVINTFITIAIAI